MVKRGTFDKWFKYEEFLFLFMVLVLSGSWLIIHWIDPKFNPLQYWFHSAGINKAPLHPLTPQPYVWPTIHRLLHNISLTIQGLILIGILYFIWRFIWRKIQWRGIRTMRIILSRDDLAAPLTVGATFDSWAQTMRTRYINLLIGNYPMSLIIAKQHPSRGKKGEVILLIRAHEKFIHMITQRLQATWTSARVEPYDLPLSFPENPITAIIRPRKRTDLYGFRAYRDYNHSITESIIQTIDSLDEDTIIEFNLKALSSRYDDKVADMQRHYERELGELKQLNPADPGMGLVNQAQLQAVAKTAGRSWWRTEIRVVASSTASLQAINGACAEASAENSLEYHRIWIRKDWLIYLIKAGMPGFWPFWRSFPMSGIFLATLWQLPSARLRTPGLTRASTRRGPGAIGLSRDEGGCTPIRDEAGDVVLKEEDRKSGVLAAGQQGTGKTTVLEQIAHYDFRQDKAVILLDPKGLMADRIRDFVPPGRKVAAWKLSQEETHEWGWNPFLQDINHSVLISGIIASMKQVWDKDAIGPRSTDFLRIAMAYVMQTGRSSTGFAAVDEFLEHPEHWGAAARAVREPLAGWLRSEAEKHEENPRFFVEALSAPKNKLREFLFYPKVRENLMPSKSLDLARVIKDKGILIVNLEPGDNLHMQDSNLIGTLLVTSIWDTIRRNGSLQNNVITSLIIDEAHRMVCDALSNAMAEGRSYGIQMSIGLQFLNQIRDETLRDSITELLQNLFLFRSSLVKETEDYSKLMARVYSNMMSPDAELQDKLQFGPDDRFNLPKFESLVRLIVDGTPKPAFLGKTIPLFPSEERDIKLPWGTCPPEWLLSAHETTSVVPEVIQSPLVETAAPKKSARRTSTKSKKTSTEGQGTIELPTESNNSIKVADPEPVENNVAPENIAQIQATIEENINEVIPQNDISSKPLEQVTEQSIKPKLISLREDIELNPIAESIGMEHEEYVRLVRIYGIQLVTQALNAAKRARAKVPPNRVVSYVETVCKNKQNKAVNED